MNKFGIVLGAAAIVTLAGCKDPEYKYDASKSQSEVKNVDTTPAPVAVPVESAPVVIEPVAAPKCTCAPGTKHTKPCMCGVPDCKCVVETKPVIVADVSKKPVEPAYTVYVVQNGDYLAKISKKYNVTIASIKRLNPSVKKDVIRVGQKLKIPGNHEIVTPVASAVAASGVKAKKSFSAYAGATKEYVVKSGDTLGAVAYGNGINIRQLKELNGLSGDTLKVGQKLRIPAEKVAKAAPAAKKSASVAKSASAKPAAAKPAAAKPAAPAKSAEAAEAVPAAPEAAATVQAEAPVAAPAAGADGKADAAVAPAEPAEAAKSETAPAATTTYVVQEGDDMTGVSIRWGVSAAEIRELNNLAEGDQLVPGQIIKLPAEAQQ